ncbi:uromodulin-like [Pelodytes ibericus]
MRRWQDPTVTTEPWYDIEISAMDLDDMAQVLWIDICPTLLCGSTSILVTIKTSELNYLKLNIQLIHLADRRCINFPTINESVTVGWPLGIGICGTTLTVNDTHAVYRNNIYLPPDPSSIIYREEIAINVSCTYPLDLSTSLGTVLWPIISYVYIPIDGYGEFKVVMALFKDVSYLTPYQEGEILLSTTETLYVGVFIAEGDTIAFNLVMTNCFATPRNNINDPIKYYIIQESCPNPADGTIHVYENGESSRGRFSVKMFKFIGDYSRVYMHCEIHLCYKLNGPSCTPTCSRSLSRSASLENKAIVTLGPIDRSDFTGLALSADALPASLEPDLPEGNFFFYLLLSSVSRSPFHRLSDRSSKKMFEAFEDSRATKELQIITNTGSPTKRENQNENTEGKRRKNKRITLILI